MNIKDRFCATNPNSWKCKLASAATSAIKWGQRGAELVKPYVNMPAVRETVSDAMRHMGVNVSPDQISQAANAGKALLDRLNSFTREKRDVSSHMMPQISRDNIKSVDLAAIQGTGPIKPNIFNAGLTPGQIAAHHMSGSLPSIGVRTLNPAQADFMTRQALAGRSMPSYNIVRQKQWDDHGQDAMDQYLNFAGMKQAPLGAAGVPPRSNRLDYLMMDAKRRRIL